MTNICNQRNATEALRYFWSMQDKRINRSELEKPMVKELYFAVVFASTISPEDIRKYKMPLSLLKVDNDSIIQTRRLLLVEQNQKVKKEQIRSAADVLSAYCTAIQKGIFNSVDNYEFALRSMLEQRIEA